MLDDVLFIGDPHGNWTRIFRAIEEEGPRHLVFVGDLDLDEPFERKMARVIDRGIEIHWIHGNHDTDREGFHDFLFNSQLADKSFSGRVVEIDGVKVAGLGGVFRTQIWHPNNGDGEPRFRTRQDWIDANMTSRWRKGVSLRHRSTIFPEDLDALADLQADVLVTHEAPSNHRYGFAELDLLAEVMGVRAIIHGHHHEAYEAELPSGIAVHGTAKADVLPGRSVRLAPAAPSFRVMLHTGLLRGQK